MKKKYFLALSLIPLALTGCSLDFSKTQLDEGLNGGGSYIDDPVEPEYFDGDTIKTGSYTSKYTLTMYTTAQMDAMSISYTKVETFLDDGLANEIANSISDPQNLFTVENEYAFVGHSVEGLLLGGLPTKNTGHLKLTCLSQSMKYVEVFAHPRVGQVSTETGYEQKIDQNSAIGINDSKLVRLSDEQAYEDTVCTFAIPSDTTTFDIVSYGNRAVLSKIVFYY